MARRTYNATVTVTLNGEQATKMLDALKKKSGDLRKELDKAISDNDAEKIRKLTREIKESEAAWKNAKKQSYDYSQVIRNINGSTLRDLEKTKKALVRELKGMTVGTKEYVDKTKLLQSVDARIKLINASQHAHATGWQRVAAGFNKYVGMVTGALAALSGLAFTLRRANEEYAKMEDILADVRKSTGLTVEQVKELNEAFKNTDTRTSREKLNESAYDAGKLGITAKKEILEFVEAANQIDVALGKDLGEGAIRQIGKMVGVFARSTKELKNLNLKEQMLAVGSAINELGMSSTAAEKYLVDFAGRLGGVATQAGISIQNILGYASALDQDMQKVEMAATAFQKFIMKLMAEPAKFAKMAGLEVGKFAELLSNDTNEAIMTVLKALNEKGGFQQLIPVFQEMGLDGARAVGVLSSMAGSMEKVAEAQAIANRALIEGVSVTREYDIKNNNAAATLEKARKRFKDMTVELGEKLSPAFIKATGTAGYLVKALGALTDFFEKHGGIILKTVIVIGAYVVAIKLQTLWTNTATAATRLFNNALKANPIGLVVSLLAAATLAFYEFSKKIKSAGDRYVVFAKDIAEAGKGRVEQIQEEKREFNNLIDAITNVNTSTEVRKKLIQELKDKYPEYLKFVDAEKVTNNELLAVLQRVNDTYETRFRIAAIQGKSDAYSNKIVEMETRRIEIEERLKEIGKVAFSEGSDLGKEWKELNKEDKSLDTEIKNYTEKMKRFSDQAQKMQAEAAESFTAAGIAKQIEDTVKHIEIAKKRIETASNDEKEAFYTARVNSLEERKAFLEKQLEAAGAVKTDQDKTKSTINESADKKSNSGEELKRELKKLEDLRNAATLELMNEYVAGTKNYHQYKEELAKIDEDYYTKKAEAEENAGKSGDASLQKAMRGKMKEAEEKEKQDRKILEDREKHFAALQKINDDFERTQAEKDAAEIIAIEQKYDKALESSRLAHERKLIDDERYDNEQADLNQKREEEIYRKREQQRAAREKKQKEEEKKFQEERNQILEKYNILSVKEIYEKELENLKKHLEDKLITDEEYEKAAEALRKKYRDLETEEDAKALDDKLKGLMKALATAQAIFNHASGAITAIQEAETARMEAEFERRLTAAGDNAEERRAIEEERSKEEIEIQKKYADANFAIQVLQISVSGLLAGIEAYKALAGIKIVGPVLGAAAAAAVGVMTVAQIAKAKAERDKLKSVSYGSPGSSGSSISERVVLPGKEEGGTLVERRQDGKMFLAAAEPNRRGYVDTPTVLVGEDGSEFVVNRRAVNNPTIKPILDIINVAQKSGAESSINLEALLSTVRPAVTGRAAGGYFVEKPAGGQNSAKPTARPDMAAKDNGELIAVLREVKNLLSDLKKNGVKAPVVLSEFERAKALMQRSDETGRR